MKNKRLPAFAFMMPLLILSGSVMAGKQSRKKIAFQTIDRLIEQEGDMEIVFNKIYEDNKVEGYFFRDLSEETKKELLLDVKGLFSNIMIRLTERGMKLSEETIKQMIQDETYIDIMKTVVRNSSKDELSREIEWLKNEKNRFKEPLKQFPDEPNIFFGARETRRKNTLDYYSTLETALTEELENKNNPKLLQQQKQTNKQHTNNSTADGSSNFVWKALAGAAAATGLVWLGYTCYKKFKERKEKQSHQGGLSDISPDNAAPSIDHIEWGKIIVLHDGQKHTYRDAKVWPRQSKEWNWKETGTRHNPGTQIADLKEFIDEVDTVILSKGMDLVLQVPQETITYAQSKSKKVYTGETKEMVALYNKLVKEGKKVGGLFHSTC